MKFREIFAEPRRSGDDLVAAVPGTHDHSTLLGAVGGQRVEPEEALQLAGDPLLQRDVQRFRAVERPVDPQMDGDLPFLGFQVEVRCPPLECPSDQLRGGLGAGVCIPPGRRHRFLGRLGGRIPQEGGEGLLHILLGTEHGEDLAPREVLDNVDGIAVSRVGHGQGQERLGGERLHADGDDQALEALLGPDGGDEHGIELSIFERELGHGAMELQKGLQGLPGQEP
jgi:hypothetical protein